MNALTDLQWFNIEGKRTDGQINRATASPFPVPAQICLSVCQACVIPARGLLLHRKGVCQCVCLCMCMGVRVSSHSISAFWCLMRREEVEGREECHGGPLGAELDTLTSARKWSIEHTSRLPGDSLALVFEIFLSAFFYLLKTCYLAKYLVQTVSLSILIELSVAYFLPTCV